MNVRIESVDELETELDAFVKKCETRAHSGKISVKDAADAEMAEISNVNSGKGYSTQEFPVFQ